MPRPRTSKNKPYGRQAKGKTIKSLSLDDAVVEQVQREADKRGISFSELVNGIIKGTIKLGVVLFAAHHFAPSATARALKMAAAWVGGF